MAEMYGAPVGIQASDENIRQNLHAGLMAQKALGEIAMQPEELALKRAQTLNTGALARLHTADAALKEAATRDAALMRKIDLEARAEQQAIDQAKLAGVDLTVADRPKEGFSATQSAATPLERFAATAYNKGMPLDMITPVMEKAAKIRKEEATMLNQSTNAVVHQLAAQKAIAEQLGSAASYALQGPTQYAQVRAMGGLPPGLPLSFDLAAPQLQQLVSTSVSVKDRTDLEIKERNAKASEARAAAAQVSANASAARAGAYVATSATRRDALKKALGPGSEEAADAKRATTEAARARAFKTQLSFAPPVPLRFTAAHEGRLFTGDDKKIYRYLGMGPPSRVFPDGTPRFIAVTHAEAALQNPTVRGAMQEEGEE